MTEFCCAEFEVVGVGWQNFTVIFDKIVFISKFDFVSAVDLNFQCGRLAKSVLTTNTLPKSSKSSLLDAEVNYRS
jgi:hypothetical protein